MTTFAIQLRANIRAYIARARRQGTTAMSIDNLCQCVPTPSPYIDGAPRDQFHYKALFSEVAANERDIARFITLDLTSYRS